MTYIANVGHIIDPVSINDVQQALSSGDTDLGTLCVHQNNNMWSVGKPISMPKIGQLTDADMKTGRTISGYSVSYGLKKRKSSTWGDYINTSTYEVRSAIWEYDKPTGGSNSPYRLTDYYNYWSTARRAITITLDGKDRVVVPSSQGGTGDVLHFTLNFLYMLYESGSISSQQMFGACSNYYPTVILTCYYSGGSYRYAKSCRKEGTSDQYWTIGEIGASSARSGVQIIIDMAEVAQVMVQQQGARYGYDCLLNGRTWTACFVLTNVPLYGTTASWEPSGKDIIRLEYESMADRKTFQIASGKLSYISAMSIAVTIKKEIYNPWYYIDSIQVTATKLTADQMIFDITGSLSCVIGTVGMSQVAADAQTINVSMNSVTLDAQTGSVTKTLNFNRVTYKPTGDADPSGSRFCTGRLTFHDIGNRGDWEGTFSIDVKSGSTFYRTVNLS